MATTKKVTKIEHAKGKGKSTRAKVIAMLEREPMTVPEICKAAGISVQHCRTLLYGFDNLQKQETLTHYSLPKAK